MLRGKERKKKERIDMQNLIEVDEEIYTLNIKGKGNRKVGKANCWEPRQALLTKWRHGPNPSPHLTGMAPR